MAEVTAVAPTRAKNKRDFTFDLRGPDPDELFSWIGGGGVESPWEVVQMILPYTCKGRFKILSLNIMYQFNV